MDFLKWGKAYRDAVLNIVYQSGLTPGELAESIRIYKAKQEKLKSPKETVEPGQLELPWEKQG